MLFIVDNIKRSWYRILITMELSGMCQTPLTGQQCVCVCSEGVRSELNGGGICQQHDMKMLPTTSHISATICSQKFAALRGAENCVIFLMLDLVEKLRSWLFVCFGGVGFFCCFILVSFLWIFIFSQFRSSLFLF